MTTTWLHRFSIRPPHLGAWFDLWPEELELRARHGFAVRRAFLQEHAEPKLTYLYDHDDPDANELYEARSDVRDLRTRAAPHVFRNVLVRPVRVELVTDPPETPTSRIAIVRRYSIVGSWDDFLATWRRIVPLRARHDFQCLFAVADPEKDVFTWAFDYAGRWEDFAEDQKGYYADPERAALRNVFDHMADYAIDPARILR